MGQRSVAPIWGFWLPRVFLATWMGPVLAAAMDVSLLPLLRDTGLGSWGWLGFGYHFAVASAGGLIFAVAACVLIAIAFALGARQPRNVKNPGLLLAAALLAAAFVLQNLATFDGAGIREHRFIIPIKIAFFGGGVIAILFGARVFQWWICRLRWSGPPFRTLTVLLMAAASAGLYYVDASYRVGHYQHLHLQLAEAVVATWVLAALAVISGRIGRPALVATGVLAVLAGASPFLRTVDGVTTARTAVVQSSVNVKQWIAVPELALDRIAPLPQGSVADVTAILEEQRLAKNVDTGAALDAEAPGRREMNLLIVSLDTVRQDHVGYAGYERNTTPNLDALAARSIVFDRAYTSYPTSSFAYSSFFTSRHPSCAPVDWVGSADEPKWPADLTLAGLLEREGFRSSAVTAFNANSVKQRFIFGHLRDGFSGFNPDQKLRAMDGHEVTDSALRVLASISRKRFFLWVHYFEPHEPYKHHAGFDFGTDPIDRYDSEIAAADAEMGRLLEGLSANGVADNTVVVVMSDHGEEFQEHGTRYHNTNLYEQQVRVPLVVFVPGLAPRRVPGVVGLVDVLPTLTGLFDIDDTHTRNGRDLWPMILGLAPDSGYAYAQLHPQRVVASGGLEMIVFGNHKLVVEPSLQIEQMFDVTKNPAETDNLVATQPETASVLRGLLAHARSEIAEIRGDGTSGRPDDEQALIAELRSEFARIRQLPRAQRPRPLGQLVAKLTDPVYGLDVRYARVLKGPLHAEVFDFLRSVFEARWPQLAVPALSLADAMEEPKLVPLLAALQSRNVRVQTALAIVRGMLADPSVLPALKALLQRDGIPDKHRLEMAALQISSDVDAQRALATLELPFPRDAARIIRGLGRQGRTELVDVANRILTGKAWKYSPPRQALASALTDLPDSSGRRRLLARLSHDRDASIARNARAILAKTVSEAQMDLLLEAGLAEAECDGALQKRDLPIAADYMKKAIEKYDPTDLDPTLKLVRILEASGQVAGAKALLDRLAEVTAGTDAADVVKARSAYSVSPRQLHAGTGPFAIVTAETETRTVRRQRYFITVRVKNTSDRVWPGLHAAVTAGFRVVMRTPDKKPVPGQAGLAVSVGRDDVRPGEEVTVTVPYSAPAKPGAYEVGLQSVVWLPRGTMKTSSIVATGCSVEVVPRLDDN